MLWAEGANDVIADYTQIPLYTVTWIARVLVFVGPAVAFIVTRRICLGLQRKDKEMLLHGYETGIIRQLPNGEFIEVHKPVNEEGRAVLEAKKAGKVRYIGFTGHKSPDIHLKMLETAETHHFHFDAVQMPLNVMDAHYNSFEKKVLPVLVKNEIGVLGMKPMGDSLILGSKTVEPVECLHYAMNLPTSVVITGCDSLPILEQALNAARNFRPMSEAEVAALLAKTTEAARNGQYELYKTTHNFDGTFQNPQWLG